MADQMLASLLADCGLPSDTHDATRILGDEQPFASSFPVTECAATTLAAVGSVASLLWKDRTGAHQDVTVNRGHTAASLVGFLYQRLDLPEGAEPLTARDLNRPLVQLYPCRDGRWIHLHGGLTHLAERTVKVLGCQVDATADMVARRVALWDAAALEEALSDAGTCGAMVRSVDEWDVHPQNRAIAPLGRISIEKIGDSDPEPAGQGLHRPLSGVRVLDLSRILAAPTHGRTLAEHGAEVLLVNSPNLENIPGFVMDTSQGKHSCLIDLDESDGARQLHALAGRADVFSQGYRGGSLVRRGFGPEEMAELRPGIIYVTINCYGDGGPWQNRPGWEQLAQTVSGIANAQGAPGAPELIAAAACDYTTGYLAALGTMAALWRRSHEGGSYHVRASLCQTANWFTSAESSNGEVVPIADVSKYMIRSDTPYGLLNHLAPVAQLSATPAHWAIPTRPVGHDPAVWAS
jgi:crotonobetainyl-CoA:carnitine CoA-transferase CaiB-like acyl-CoA transferase